MGSVVEAAEVTAPPNPYAHLRGDTHDESGELSEPGLVVPADVRGAGVPRHDIDGEGWRLVVLTVGPRGFAATLSEHFVLRVLRPVAFEDRAVAVLDDFVKEGL